MQLLAIGIIATVAVLVLAMSASAAQPIAEPTELDGQGVVSKGGLRADPDGLAAALGLDVSQVALARMVNSEFGRYRAARIGAAWAARNEARARGVSVAALLTRQRVRVDGDLVSGPGDGYFGTQRGRYASTAQDTTADAVEIATGVLSGEIDDPTGGARQFDSPGAFGLQEGTDEGDVDEVAARRIAAGNELVILDGVPESYARFWRPAT